MIERRLRQMSGEMLAMMKFLSWTTPRIVVWAWLGGPCWLASLTADDAGQAAASLGRITQFSLRDA